MTQVSYANRGKCAPISMLNQNSVFVDVETTGGNASYHRITEIAIIEINDGAVVAEWSTLLNPETFIPESIQELTGISNEMVAEYPTFRDLRDIIYDRLSGRLLVAHNARFDYGFIRNEFKRCGIRFQSPVLCTVKLSRALFPGYRHHNLDSILARYKLNCNVRHRALGDAQVLHEFVRHIYRCEPRDHVDAVLEKLLKRPTLPAKLNPQLVDQIPESPGVYIFYNEQGAVLYVGKSINMRERVLGHFSGDHANAKDMRISQYVANIDWVETAGELGALLKEANLIKELRPFYNRRLKSNDDLSTIRWNPNHVQEAEPRIVAVVDLEPVDIQNHYGLFKTKKVAQKKLKELAKEYQLCSKLMGLQKGSGACFDYQIDQCKGACVGKESKWQHHMRLLQALQPIKVLPWPFIGPIGIREASVGGREGDVHVLDNWCFCGTVNDERDESLGELSNRKSIEFDVDIYKIVRRYLNKKRRLDIVELSTSV